VDQTLRELDLRRDDRLLDCTLEKGISFGIDDAELKAVGEGMIADLVLEKVAFVEILKR
jgi:tRNA threonylcarbamoyladenosine modification (KEOPS) complex Cgi121 subunit